MKISSINYQNQHTSKAVNQKFLKKAIDKYNRCAPNHDQGHLISCLTNEVYYGFLSYKDAIDTLNAIKPYAQDCKEWIERLIKDLSSN